MRNCISFCLLFYLLGCGGDGGGSGDNMTHSVSGTILAANNSVIDSDVNDILVSPTSNDTFAVAQGLPNPVILGGYINTNYSGDEGNFYDPNDAGVLGDLKDFFSVTLTTNQSITLYIADFSDSQPDINVDLYLYDENKDLVDSSIGADSTETVEASAAGDYFIEVRAVGGASNYIFTIGQPITSATVLDPRINDEFAPDHIIVAFHENSETPKQTSKSLSPTSFQGMTNTVMKHGSTRLYQFTAGNSQQVFQALKIAPSETNRALYQTSDKEEQLKLDTLRVIEALNRNPDVRYAEPNFIRRPFFVPDDTHYAKQWHYPLINLPQAWDITQGSSDVIVAVIDTGILSEHPDIQGQLVTDGYDFISKESIARDGDEIDGSEIDDDPEDEGDEMQGGSSFHGTHVSGTIAAATNNAMGVTGIAFQSKIMPLRALGVGGGLSSDITEAMLYAARLDNDSGTKPSRRANIINMSIGGSSFSSHEEETIDLVRKAGVIIIAAAGNEGSNVFSYPAAYDGVVSVSAVGPEKELAPYSNYGTTIDVAAPGGDFSKDINSDGYGDGVLSTSGDDSSGTTQNGYSYAQGTSMSSPHMAGVVALMKSVYPEMTPDELDGFLAGGFITEDLGLAGRDDNFGYGLIDAYKAVLEAANPGKIPSFLTVNPLTLNFGNSSENKTLTVSKSNDNPLTDIDVTDDADWLTITADAVDGEGIGTYTVAVDSNGLPDGPYYGTITFESSQNSIDISVTMYQGTVAVAGDSGFHYVLLIDVDTNLSFYQEEISASNGLYTYRFDSVAQGNYIVFAGTDSDNDFYLGDSGESSGAYISMDQPTIIRVDKNLSGIDFNTSFNLNLPTELSTDTVKPESRVRRMGTR